MHEIYDWLLGLLPRDDAVVEQVQLGLSWTMARVDGHAGFAFSPRQVPRTWPWAGSIAGRPVSEVAGWLRSWDPAESVVGLAVLNAAVNARAECAEAALPLKAEGVPGHLQVFAHFRSQVAGQRVAVIGRYPGLETFWSDVPYDCIERNPQDGDLPDMAAESVLPAADWVFITASSIANKTLPRLLSLAAGAQVVLMGPSMPWSRDWKAYGVDYIAGVRLQDMSSAAQVVAEGGGTRLFAGPVEYALLALN